MNYFYGRARQLKADGVDFMPVFSEGIIASYKTVDLPDVKVFPKTNYKFWKIVNGKKQYIDA